MGATQLVKWGATSGFPAWKRVGAGLQARLADDSDYAALTVGGATVIGDLLSPGAGADSFVAGLGASATLSATDAIAIGRAAFVSSAEAIAIGNFASATAGKSIAIGVSSSALFDNVSIGWLATATNGQSVAIGALAAASGIVSNTAVGAQALATGSGGNKTAVGSLSEAKFGQGTAVGAHARGSFECTSVGYLARTDGVSHSTSVGSQSRALHSSAIVLGRAAVTTAANRCTIGTIGGSFDQELQIGSGFGAWGVAPPGTQPAKISDVAETAGASYTSNEQDMLNALKTAVHALIDVVEGAGLAASV
jgi:hypothetical protein